MAMTHEEFEALVNKLEAQARQHPAGYKTRVLLLALLGFGYPGIAIGLLLGLPLMKSLTPAQFEAVLAHEFGHLAGGHGRVSNWIYRLRLSWARLLSALEGRKAGSWLFLPFFNWYAPYFSAYSFPLARA